MVDCEKQIMQSRAANAKLRRHPGLQAGGAEPNVLRRRARDSCN
jgi:hypothetical protein